MKKILPFIVTISLVAVIAIIFVSVAKKSQPITIITGNTAMKPLPVDINRTNDPECAMLIKTIRNNAEVVAPDGRTWFFDDPGCMVLWIKNRSFKSKAKLWVHTLDTRRWIDARTAHYGTTESTAMHYGFGSREYETNKTISYKEMYMRMLRGENLTNPKIRKKLLGI